MLHLDKIVEWLRSFFDHVGRTRAARELRQYGHHEAAERLIQGKSLID